MIIPEDQFTMEMSDPIGDVKRMRTLAKAHSDGMEFQRDNPEQGRKGIVHTEPACLSCMDLGMLLTRHDHTRKPSRKEVLTPVTDDRECRLPVPHPSHEHRYIRDGGTQGHYYCWGT
jgi:hypothetical protein